MSGPSRASAIATSDPGTFARSLLRDFERTSSRAYSEEGIPVFLIGENRAAEGAKWERGPAGDPFGSRVAADFVRAAEALPRVRAQVTAEDVGKLIEVLADRDFGSGQNPPRS